MQGLPKLLLAALLGIVVTAGGAWLTLARDVVTEAQAIDLIENRSPYVEDRKLLLRNVEETAKLREAVSELTATIKGFAVVLQFEIDGHEGDDH